MSTHKDRHDEYARRFFEAVGCTQDQFDSIDWTNPVEAAKHLHAKAVPRVLKLMAEDLLKSDPPGPPLAWWHISNAKFELGDVEGAITACKRGIEVNAVQPGVKDLRALLQRLEGARDSDDNKWRVA